MKLVAQIQVRRKIFFLKIEHNPSCWQLIALESFFELCMNHEVSDSNPEKEEEMCLSFSMILIPALTFFYDLHPCSLIFSIFYQFVFTCNGLYHTSCKNFVMFCLERLLWIFCNTYGSAWFWKSFWMVDLTFSWLNYVWSYCNILVLVMFQAQCVMLWSLSIMRDWGSPFHTISCRSSSHAE